MADTDSMMPDPSLLLGEDRDDNVAKWLVDKIFGDAPAAVSDGEPAVDAGSTGGEFDAVAQGLFAEYFGIEPTS